MFSLMSPLSIIALHEPPPFEFFFTIIDLVMAFLNLYDSASN